MSTVTRPAAVTVARPTRRTALHLCRGQLRLAALLWAIVTVVAVVITLAWGRTGSTPPSSSVWENIDQGPRWFLFSMGIGAVIGYLPAHVANGRTRRSFWGVVAGLLGVLAVLFGALRTIGFLVERAVFDAQGWSADLRQAHLFSDVGQVPLVLADGVLLFAVYAASGLLVGATYFRYGGLWGTLTLPLTVGPALLADTALASGWLAWLLGPTTTFRSSAVAVVALHVVLLAGMALTSRLLLQGAPVRAKVG